MARNPRPRPRPRPEPQPEPIVTETGTSGDDTIVAGLGTVARFSGGGGNDSLQGWIRADVLDGGDGNDRIDDGDSESVNGGAADTILGGSGDDFIISRFGADLIDGGAGVDLALVLRRYDGLGITSSGASGSGGTLTLSDGTRIVDVERLTLDTGDGSDRITTGASVDRIVGGGGRDVIATLGGDDYIDGGTGDDVLDGGGGSDFLVGNLGLDTLIGGAGADLFALDQSAGGLDTIRDFDFAEGDRLLGTFVEFIDDETNRIIEDPIAEGRLRVSDTAEGALLEVLTSPGVFASSALLVGVTAGEFTLDFLI